MNFGLLLSAHAFEEFWGGPGGMTKERYALGWRSGWVWSYCRMLKAEGITPYVYVASLTGSRRFETPEGYHVRFLGLGGGYRLWTRVELLGRSPYGRFASGLVNGVSLLPSLGSELRSGHLHAMGFQEYWPSRYDLLVSRVGLPSIAIDQGSVGDREVKIAKSRTLPQAGRIVTQTSHEAELLRALGGRAERVPNAIDADFWAPGPEGVSDRESVICVAQLNDEHKRISDLLRAVARLGEPWRLQLVGAGRDRARLERLTAQLGIAARVEFVGFTSDREEVRALVREAGVFALPSAREGLPISLLEAMATATPVVCSDIPAMTEVVTDGHDGRVVGVGRPEQLAEAIVDAGARRDQLGPRARATIEAGYAEGVVGRRLADVIREVASATY